ncbi:MAG: hypothetical protein WD431_23860 [Cyclobacteriaceae bacterium]
MVFFRYIESRFFSQKDFYREGRKIPEMHIMGARHLPVFILWHVNGYRKINKLTIEVVGWKINMQPGMDPKNKALTAVQWR